ncbi:hypothetical protein L3i22_085510 [Actinoplanes sp. L3-i22]|nr:hypothetical protein L3i22_085510 [Actinoplanes sp. L3-i22]
MWHPALDGEIRARGTTNVDVNQPLYTALTRVGGGDPLRLTVGPDEPAVTTLDGHVVEKRVPLPERWLRGLAEAGFLAAGFDLRAEVPGGQAAQLLHRLPANRGDDRGLVPAGRLGARHHRRVAGRRVPGGCAPARPLPAAAAVHPHPAAIRTARGRGQRAGRERIRWPSASSLPVCSSAGARRR